LEWSGQMAYFRPFSNVISIKSSRVARKNTSNMADVCRWRHRVMSLQVLPLWKAESWIWNVKSYSRFQRFFFKLGSTKCIEPIQTFRLPGFQMLCHLENIHADFTIYNKCLDHPSWYVKLRLSSICGFCLFVPMCFDTLTCAASFYNWLMFLRFY
jgi:hypothetical protein